MLLKVGCISPVPITEKKKIRPETCSPVLTVTIQQRTSLTSGKVRTESPYISRNTLVNLNDITNTCTKSKRSFPLSTLGFRFV